MISSVIFLPSFSLFVLEELRLQKLLMKCFLQSAIGEGMTRRDHADVSNQVYCLGAGKYCI